MTLLTISQQHAALKRTNSALKLLIALNSKKQNGKILKAINILNTSKCRNDGTNAMNGLTIADLKIIADRLDITLIHSRKNDIAQQIVDRTIGTKLKSDVFK